MSPEVANVLSKVEVHGVSVLVIAMIAGRAWTAIRTNGPSVLASIRAEGGIVGIWRSVIFGSTTTNQTQK